jgi:trigger factor
LKVEYSEETTVRKALTFEIEAEQVEGEIEKIARDYGKKARLPGFRPGKTPTGVIRQRFKPQILEDVAERIVNKVVFDEIEGRGLKPVAAPKVVDLKIDEGQPMTFRAVFETLPIVELPDYQGLHAKGRAAKVTEQDVDQELEGMRDNAARYEPVEGRAVQEGDHLLADVSWRPVAGGKLRRNENALLEVGSEQNHKDLNAALVGISPGETRSVRVRYEAKQEGAGEEEVDYTITAKGIKNKVLPELDDDFAKDLGDWGSLAELREGIRKRLLENDERRADRELKNALIEALVDRASFEVPEALVERHMAARTENAARGLAMQGIDPSKLGVDWRKIHEGQREESLKAAKADILLDEVARREAIEVSDAELEAELGRLAERYQRSREAVRAQLEKEGELSALRARIREEKVLDLLKSTATLEIE